MTRLESRAVTILTAILLAFIPFAFIIPQPPL